MGENISVGVYLMVSSLSHLLHISSPCSDITGVSPGLALKRMKKQLL